MALSLFPVHFASPSPPSFLNSHWVHELPFYNMWGVNLNQFLSWHNVKCLLCYIHSAPSFSQRPRGFESETRFFSNKGKQILICCNNGVLNLQGLREGERLPTLAGWMGGREAAHPWEELEVLLGTWKASGESHTVRLRWRMGWGRGGCVRQQ